MLLGETHEGMDAFLYLLCFTCWLWAAVTANLISSSQNTSSSSRSLGHFEELVMSSSSLSSSTQKHSVGRDEKQKEQVHTREHDTQSDVFLTTLETVSLNGRINITTKSY
jgi:hypothetical protein